MALVWALWLAVLHTAQASPVMTRQGLLEQKSTQAFCSTLLNFNNFYYSLDEQKNISGIPADLSVHWKTGNVFFTLITEEMKMNLLVYHPSGEFETIKVAGLGQSTTVDNLNDIVYLATDNGVYKYKEDGSIELFTALGEDVMYLALSNDGTTMYIATWPQNRVHKITSDGQKQEAYNLIPNGHGLTIDTRNNIYFVATKTTYILKNGYNIPIRIKGLPTDRMTGVFVSRSDEIFAMDELSNLYSIDSESATSKLLGSFNISGVNTFAMDSADNVLVGIRGAIVKFNAYEKNPCPNNFALYEPRKFTKELPNHRPKSEILASTPTVVIQSTSYPRAKKGKRHYKRRHRKTTTSTTEATEEEEDEEE